MNIEHWLVNPNEAPETWDNFPWPEWIPTDIRASIEKFWASMYGRGPKNWLRDHDVQAMPSTGERITTEDCFSEARDERGCKPSITGRYIHRWNNMGVVIADDGRAATISPRYRSGARHLSTFGGSLEREEEEAVPVCPCHAVAPERCMADAARKPGCLCQWEEGDSPCPVHGEEEEDGGGSLEREP